MRTLSLASPIRTLSRSCRSHSRWRPMLRRCWPHCRTGGTRRVVDEPGKTLRHIDPQPVGRGVAVVDGVRPSPPSKDPDHEDAENIVVGIADQDVIPREPITFSMAVNAPTVLASLPGPAGLRGSSTNHANPSDKSTCSRRTRYSCSRRCPNRRRRRSCPRPCRDS